MWSKDLHPGNFTIHMFNHYTAEGAGDNYTHKDIHIQDMILFLLFGL